MKRIKEYTFSSTIYSEERADGSEFKYYNGEYSWIKWCHDLDDFYTYSLDEGDYFMDPDLQKDIREFKLDVVTKLKETRLNKSYKAN